MTQNSSVYFVSMSYAESLKTVTLPWKFVQRIEKFLKVYMTKLRYLVSDD